MQSRDSEGARQPVLSVGQDRCTAGLWVSASQEAFVPSILADNPSSFCPLLLFFVFPEQIIAQPKHIQASPGA